MTIDWLKVGGETVAVASVLHTVLPPWEAFNDFPNVQKVYKLLVYFIGYIALNGRSAVWGSISTAAGSKVSDAVTKTNGNGHSGGQTQAQAQAKDTNPVDGGNK